jgi:hypothetical protein
MDGAERGQPADPQASGEWTRRAIDVMTAWSEAAEGKRFVAERVASYVGADAEGAITLTVGFINLSAILLLQLQAVTGCEPRAILQDAAKVTL